ncbi:MAG TPA: glycosyltransferase [Stellaceae bacterium]|nr:glycosyltransferase [Stellaceae bacterium]
MPIRPARSPTIWFETGDLFVHFNWNLHPTGIQRVGLEILRVAWAKFGDRVAFCRLSRYTGRFEPMDFARIVAASAGPEFGEPASRRFERALAVSRQLVRFLARFPKTLYVDYFHGRSRERAFAEQVVSGDMVVCLGLPWGSPDYGPWIAAAKRRYGFRFGLLIHDVIPFTDVELCQEHFAAGFQRWFENVIGVCDLVFVSSEFSRDAIHALCRMRGWPLPPIERIPFGAGFTVPAPAEDRFAIAWQRRFVLFVSSIERRKNHVLLLRVWRALLQRHGVAEVPSLVFLGVGGDVGKVLREFRADAMLRDKIVMIRGASDAVVHEAYRRCLFTVYPSLTEGWGLPVAESLAFGKFCIASNRASLPEVGGDLVDYFDPADDAGAIAAVERALFEPGYLDARTARIERDYHAPTWSECATMLVDKVDALDAPVPVSEALPAAPA